MYISPSQAIERINAETFHSTGQSGQRRAQTLTAPLEMVRGISITDRDALYLIRQGEVGFVAPADDTLEPIIGESEETDFTVDLPPCYEEILEDYAREVEWVQGGEMQMRRAAAADNSQLSTLNSQLATVSPLLSTKWNQTAPWNNNCVFEGKKCYAGCVPISIAQLLYFWWQKGFSRGCSATDDYTTKTNLYEVKSLQPVTRFDFESMTTGKPTTTEGKKAVAEMLQHIGRAIHADYKPTGTGVSIKDYEPRLTTVFHLGDNIQTIYASKIGLATFCERIRKELESGRPVMMTGCNSKYTAAHSFICDGYRAKDDKFHYNFGWGGSYNGYYKMNAITPTTSRDFSYYKHAFIGIQPAYKLGDVNRDGQVDISDVLGAVETTLKGEYKEEADVNSDGQVNIDDAQTIVDNILGKTKL